MFEAVEEALDRAVALKTIPATGKWNRFQREMKALAQAQHPGIVSIYSHGQTPECYYFSMELIRGSTLKDLYQRKREEKHLPGIEEVRKTAALVLRVAQALAHAHEKGVFHRDISPGNILIAEDGSPKIIDFGLAEVADLSAVTLTGSVFGTPPYLGPEVLGGRGEADERLCDLYALGIVLYEGLTLSHPYPHETLEELFLRIQSSEPVPPRSVNRAIPRNLEAVLMRAIAREPRDRYAGMKEFAADLESFLAGRPVEALKGSISTRLIKAARRWKTATLAVASAILFVVLLAGGYFVYTAHQRARESTLAMERLKDALRKNDLENAKLYLEIVKANAEPEVVRTAESAMRLKELARQYRTIHDECVSLAGGDRAKLAAKFEELTGLRDELLRMLGETKAMESYLEPPAFSAGTAD